MLLYAIFVSVPLTGVRRPSNIEIGLKIRTRGFITVSTMQFGVDVTVRLAPRYQD